MHRCCSDLGVEVRAAGKDECLDSSFLFQSYCSLPQSSMASFPLIFSNLHTFALSFLSLGCPSPTLSSSTSIHVRTSLIPIRRGGTTCLGCILDPARALMTKLGAHPGHHRDPRLLAGCSTGCEDIIEATVLATGMIYTLQA